MKGASQGSHDVFLGTDRRHLVLYQSSSFQSIGGCCPVSCGNALPSVCPYFTPRATSHEVHTFHPRGRLHMPCIKLVEAMVNLPRGLRRRHCACSSTGCSVLCCHCHGSSVLPLLRMLCTQLAHVCLIRPAWQLPSMAVASYGPRAPVGHL